MMKRKSKDNHVKWKIVRALELEKSIRTYIRHSSSRSKNLGNGGIY